MSRKVKVNMEGVESFRRCPEGEWLAKLKKIELGESQGSGDECLKAQFEVIDGRAKGDTVFETFSLNEKALWKLKGFLEAIGMKSTGKLNLDLDKLEDKVCIIDVIHDEYQGKKRAKVASYINPEDVEPEDDEEIVEEDDEEIVEEDDEEEPPKSKKTTKSKKSTKSKKKPEPEPEEEDDEDDEDDWEEVEDDEEEPPKKETKKKSKKTTKSKKTAKKATKEPESEEDDEDWEEDDD